MIDVKNHYGDYFYQDKDFHLYKTGERVNNPLHQLQRCENLLQGLLRQHQLPYEIKSYVVFINPEFTLYQTPLKLNVILPSQIRRFVQKLNQTPVRITPREERLIQLLQRVHVTENRRGKLPVYEYGRLQNGIPCLKCGVMMEPRAKRKLACPWCDSSESVESAGMRMAIEFNILFNKEKITTNRMYEWCGGMLSGKVIRRVLFNFMKPIGKTKSVYFEFY